MKRSLKRNRRRCTKIKNRRRCTKIKNRHRTCKTKRMRRKRRMNPPRRQLGGVDINKEKKFTLLFEDAEFKCEASDPDPRLASNHKYKYTDFHLDKILMHRHEGTFSKKMAVATASLIEEDPTFKVAVKMCPSFHENYYQVLTFEKCLYEKVTKLKLQNTVNYVCSVEIDSTDLEQPSATFSEKFIKDFHKVYGKDKPADRKYTIFMLFTEMTPGVETLESFIPKIKTFEQLKSIIFQVIITIIRLLRNTIQHNDLHVSNILIDTNALGTITYSLLNKKHGDEIFVVPVEGCKVLLYDWDLGLNPHRCGDNPSYRDDVMCSSYGVCPNLNFKFDLNTFMNNLSKFQIKDNEFLTFYNDVMGEYDIFATFPYRMCNAASVGNELKISDLQKEKWYICRNFNELNVTEQENFYKEFTDKDVFYPEGITYIKIKKTTPTSYNEKFNQLVFEKLVCVPFEDGEPSTIKYPFEVLGHDYFSSFQETDT